MNETSVMTALAVQEEVYSRKINVSQRIFLFIKRICDIIIGIVGCVFLIPLTIIIKIASILNGDKDPIFFKQERIGKDGKVIKIFKYRSMVVNAEQILEQLLANNEDIREEYSRNKKIKNDPRITKIGKFIRKTSIDEFPQFINVLIGDMSIVGPRPYLFREKEDIGLYYKYIIDSKPGITGMWQVNGRSNTDFQRRLEFDRYYFNNRNIRLDFILFFKTFSKVLKKDGAK